MLLLSLVLLGACHYDWGVGPRSGDAGPEADIDATDDAAADTSVDDAAPGEASSDQCDFYDAQIGLAYSRILACKQACSFTVQNECDCDVSVEDPNSEAVHDYLAAVSRFKNAGCKKDCGACTTVTHVCLSSDGGGGICI